MKGFYPCDWCGKKFFTTYEEDCSMYCNKCRERQKTERPPIPTRLMEGFTVTHMLGNQEEVSK